jgi:hypothetical protein
MPNILIKRNISNSSQKPPLPKSSPIQVPNQTNIVSGSPSIIDSMKQGFSFGIGSSIAHNLFDSKPNSKNKDENKTINKNEITNEPKLTTDKMYELYNKCLEENDRNINCNIILENNKQ